MKLALLALVASALLCAVSAKALPGAEPDAAGGPRWGHFRMVRLKAKLTEYSADLREARQEAIKITNWGRRFCAQTRNIYNQRVARAKSTQSEWNDILGLRKALAGFHKGRHNNYQSHHAYVTAGPRSRRQFVHRCYNPKRGNLRSCQSQWCHSNPESCDRWLESRRHYFAARFHVHLASHGHITLNAWKRVDKAKRQLERAAQRVADLRRARLEAVHSCQQRALKIRAHFKARIDWLLSAVRAFQTVIVQLRQARKAREATYKPYYMTKCHHLGGQHHAYNCVLDAHNRDRAHHRFSFCKHRGPVAPELHSLQFRCYK